MTRLYSLDVRSSEVHIPLPAVSLDGLLSIPDGARGMILFAQGRGSSRHNAVDTYLAIEYQHAGFATLLLDLYTPEELEEDAADAHLRFRVAMLAQRLIGVVDWLTHNPSTHNMSLGVMACSTGGAAGILAAVSRPEAISGLVCRSARPDLAKESLQYLHTPILLIVGDKDPLLTTFNEEAISGIAPEVARLLHMTAVSHDFVEPGAMENLSAMTVEWFSHHLTLNRAI